MVAKISPSHDKKKSPQVRLRRLLRAARTQGVKPIKDFDKFLNDVGEAWPKDESIDEFILWLRKARREGQY